MEAVIPAGVAPSTQISACSSAARAVKTGSSATRRQDGVDMISITPCHLTFARRLVSTASTGILVSMIRSDRSKIKRSRFRKFAPYLFSRHVGMLPSEFLQLLKTYHAEQQTGLEVLLAVGA